MTAPLWTGPEVRQAIGGTGATNWQATGISIDSRSLKPGDLFVALVGDRTDGHDYLDRAAQAGAAAGIVTHVPPGTSPAFVPMVVGDTRKALEDLGRAARSRSPARIAAITGSVGKTGTKEALALVLSRQGQTAATMGNLNNHFGVPLSLSRLPREAAYAVYELGMNHPGEIAPLSRMVRPHVAVITTVTAAHLEFFDDESGIADEKSSIMEGLEPGGVAVLNRDNRHYERMEAHAERLKVGRVISFGTHPDATIRMTGFHADEGGSSVSVTVAGRTLAYYVGSPGRHAAANSLAVLGAVIGLGADLDQAAAALVDAKPPTGRGEPFDLVLTDGRRIRIIDDSYNASPAAVRATLSVLHTLKPGQGGRRIAALGDMLELGPTSPALHADLASSVVEFETDLVFTSGPLMRHLFDALPEARRGAHRASIEDLSPGVLEALRDGDIIVVKGSHGSRMHELVAALKQAGRPQPSPGKVG